MLFVAEIGINHNGNVEIAKELIRAAKNSGADYVKFQKRDLNLSIPNRTKWKTKDTPWGKTTYFEYKKRLEFNKKQYDIIDSFCKEIDIPWTASVWDANSLKFILDYNVPYIKVPSACITNIELLKEIKSHKVPVMLSIGMSTQSEIKRAVNLLRNCKLTVMHCNSSYPAKDNELDLRVIQKLKKMYPWCEIGYSSHDNGIYPSIAAAALGAKVIEKHITLDKSMWGTDQKASLDAIELKELIRTLKMVPTWLGNNHVTLYPSEIEIMNKLRV